MAKKSARAWVHQPRKASKPSVDEKTKAEVLEKASQLVEGFLKPKCIKPPPKHKRWNYLIDITTKWHQSFFYFRSTYASRGPTAISPTFASRFARLEYVGHGRFNLAYMRHTGKWWEIFQRLSLDACLDTIRENDLFQPE
jgi:hypothetical protein